jgi:hypothetical protein
MSYLIGLPVGLVVLGLLILIPLLAFQSGYILVIMQDVFGKAAIGLIAAYLVALWIAGKNAVKALAANPSLLRASFMYSLTVNGISWLTFLIVAIFDNTDDAPADYFSAIFYVFALFVLINTFTVARLICYLIRRNF